MPHGEALVGAPVADAVEDVHVGNEAVEDEVIDRRPRIDPTRSYLHENVILQLRTTEFSAVVNTLLICHLARIVWASPASDLPFLCMDRVLLAVCYVHFGVFCGRTKYWWKNHALYSAARNQPTPRLLLMGVDRARAYQVPRLNILDNLWLVLVPCLTYFASKTALSVNLRYHWKWCLWGWLASMILVPIMFFVLRSSIIIVDHGMTQDCLEANTKISAFDPSKPWSAFGDPQCGICLVEYQKNDPIRLLPCDHHFHTKCVDGWLKKYTNHCPFCRAPIEPANTKED